VGKGARKMICTVMQACPRAPCPRVRLAMVGTARKERAFAHPHMGPVVKSGRPGRSGNGNLDQWRGAEPCVAQRAATLGRCRDWLPAGLASFNADTSADHCITSYPVGPIGPYPHSACMRWRKPRGDGTHLRERLLCWPKGGTVTIHPALRGNCRARGVSLESVFLVHVLMLML